MLNYITASRSINVQRVIQIAEAELGYVEKGPGDDLYDKTASSGRRNYTKYSKELTDAKFFGYSIGQGAWCAVFVCWCYYKAFGKDIAKELLCGGHIGCTQAAQQFKNSGQFYTSNPMPGDQIFYNSDSDNGIEHTGLVYKVDSSSVYTIEGNTSGGIVDRKTHYLTDSSIVGYGRPMFGSGSGKSPVYSGFANTQFSSPADPGSMWFTSPCESLFVVNPFGTNEDERTGRIWNNPGIDLLCESITGGRSAKISAIHAGKVTGISGNTMYINHGYVKEDIYKSSYTVINGSVSWTKSVGTNMSIEDDITIGTVSNIASNTVVRLEMWKNGVRVDPSAYLFSGIYPYFEKDDKVLTNWHPMYTDEDVNEGKIGGNVSMMHTRRGVILSKYAPHMLKDGKIYENYCDGYNGVGPSSDKLVGSIQSTIADEEILNLYRTVTTDENGEEKIVYSDGYMSSDAKLKIATYMYEYLLTRGWSPNAIFAFIGNVCGESSGNPAKWEESINWSNYDENRDGILDKPVLKSNGSVLVDYNDGGSMVAGYKYRRGFGLIGWTPWFKYWNWAEERGYDPHHINGQLERISNFCNGSDYIIMGGGSYKNACMEAIYRDNYGGDAELKAYIDSHGQDFNRISAAEFIKSSLPVGVLTMIYTFNVEKPSAVYMHAGNRIKEALKYQQQLGDRVVASNTAPDKKAKYWLGKSFGGHNPYPTYDKTTIPSNNAYCWGRAYQVVECLNKMGLPANATIPPVNLRLCGDSNVDWYDYNKEHGHYKYGKMPRAGAVMCWTYNRQLKGAVRSNPLTYAAMVEDVIGNDAVAISAMTHNAKPGDDLDKSYSYTISYNYDSNWGMDPTYYTFRGFIYVSPDKKSIPGIIYDDKNKCLQISSDGKDITYNSISFGIPEVKHYSAIRITYDAKIIPQRNATGNIMWNYNNIDKTCDIYFHLSQQVITSTCNFEERFPGTYLPAKKEEKSSSGKVIRPEVFGDPFPFGVLLLKSSLSKHLMSKGTYSPANKSYYINDVTDIFSLINYEDSSGNQKSAYYDANNMNENTRYFQRDIQTYFGVTTFVEKLEEENGTESMTPSYIEINIKEIQLLR